MSKKDREAVVASKKNPLLDSTYYFEKQKMYIDNAKNYIQISCAALFLPITFVEKFLSVADGAHSYNWIIIFSWLFYLISIGAGLLYQYFAIKYIEHKLNDEDGIGRNWFLMQNPSHTYFVMLITFYLGSVFFVIFAISKMHALA